MPFKAPGSDAKTETPKTPSVKVAAPAAKAGFSGGPPKVGSAAKTTAAPSPAAQNVVAAKAPTAGPSEMEKLQAEFFRTGIAFFKLNTGDAKTHLTVAPTTSAKAVPAAPVSSPTAAKVSVPKPTAAAPVAAKTPASSPSVATAGKTPAPAGGIPSLEELQAKNRKELVDIATANGITATGKKREELVEMLANHGKTSPDAVADDDGLMTQMAEANMAMLDDNLDKFEQYIDPNLPEDQRPTDGYLGCGGDCVNCPNPMGHPQVFDQIKSCYTDMCQATGTEPVLLAAA